MADIKQRISLDGADDVANKLKKIGDTGSDAFKKLKEYSDRGGASFEKLGGKEGGHAEFGEELKEALHTLHPVLEQAGLELGNLGAFARLAGAGLVPLGAALAGSVLVGLAKVGEETQKTKNRISALGGGEGGFEGLSEEAKKLGISLDKLQPGYEKLLSFNQKLKASQSNTIIHPPGFLAGENEENAAKTQYLGSGGLAGPLPQETLRKAYGALIGASRTDTTDTDKAIGAVDSFLDNVREGGFGSKALEGLQSQLPNTANFVARSLSQEFGRNFGNSAELGDFLQRSGRTITPQQLLSDVSQHSGEADQQAQAAHGVTEAFEGLEASAHRLAEALGADRGISKAIDGFAGVIDSITDQVEHLRHPEEYRPGGGRFIGPVRPEDVHAEGPAKSLGEVFSGKEGDLLGRFVGYVRNSGQSSTANPFGATSDFLTKALTNPGALQEKVRPSDVPPGTEYEPTYGWPVAPRGGAQEREGRPAAPAQPEQHSEAQGNQLLASLTQALQSSGADASQAVREGFAQGNQSQGEQVGLLQGILSAITALLNKANPTNTRVEGDVDTIGVRGATGGYVELDSGGHVRGPGTSTSDSIHAKLSNGEYVVKASTVDKVGVDFMDELNAGKFADGGQVSRTIASETRLGPGDHQITFDPASGGAYVDGTLHMPGDPLLNDPTVRKGIEESKAGMNQKSSSGKKHDPFVGRFGYDPDTDTGGYADGGLIGRLSKGYASGGKVDYSSALDFGSSGKDGSAVLSRAVGDVGSSDGGHDGRHFGSLDLRTDLGEHRVYGPEETLKAMSRAAVAHSIARTGKRPNWHQGG